MGARLYSSSPRTAAQMVLDMGNRLGGLYIADTVARTGQFGAITALEAAVANLVTTQNGIWQGTTTAVPIPAGTTIYGNFTTVTLASGKVIAYHAP